MTDETDNTPDMDVTDNVELSEDDSSDEFDYFDPDEDQDNEEVETSEETDDEADEDEGETADDQEAEEPEVEDEPIEDFVTKLKAETPRLAEYLKGLEEGNLRQQDYSRKTQEVANERKTVQADAQRMERITEALVEQLSSLVPDMPDVSLAYTDAATYTAQKAQHEAAMAQVQKLLELGNEPKEVTAGMNEADRAQALQKANNQLIERFPEAAGGESREKFFNGIAAAASEAGFTNEELSANTDPRLFELAHWAKIGKASVQSAAKAKAKVSKAPPAVPRKRGQGAGKQNGNADAMRKLSQSGSLRDALAVDFD